MARIVIVHGIGHQRSRPEHLLAAWHPALQVGLHLAGAPRVTNNDVACGFYGDLFLRPGKRSLGDPFDEMQLDEEELALLLEWWREAARTDDRVIGPDARTRVRTPRMAQRALDALSRSRFFAGLGKQALIFDLKQVRRYLIDKQLRQQICARVTNVVSVDTSVLVAHSLGSVVAYEVLCAHPESPVRTLITLGSPLGIRNLIFDRLDPRPANGRGRWPRALRHWTNIADEGDVVALVKRLAPRFDKRVADERVFNGSHAHRAGEYLAREATGHAIAAGLDN